MEKFTLSEYYVIRSLATEEKRRLEKLIDKGCSELIECKEEIDSIIEKCKKVETEYLNHVGAMDILLFGDQVNSHAKQCLEV